MKVLQWTLAVVGAIALGIVGFGLFLPSKFEVSRSASIQAAPDKVYDLIADPRHWKSWSAWNRRDPNMDITYSGPPFGQGAKWAWKSKSEGTGQMEFTKVEPNRRVDYALFFPEYGMRSAGAFRVEPVGTGTQVTWTNSGDVGPNPLRHYVAWLMDRLVGPDFEAGLANLKAVAERP